MRERLTALGQVSNLPYRCWLAAASATTKSCAGRAVCRNVCTANIWRIAKTILGLTVDDEIIYLDNNATTQLDPAVIEEMLPFLTKYYGNPSSGYGFAAMARKAINLARERLAALLGCEPTEIVFTSGGTESNNAIINSTLRLETRGGHVVATGVEHSAVLRPCQDLAKRGCAVTFLGVDRHGDLDLGELEAAIRRETALV